MYILMSSGSVGALKVNAGHSATGGALSSSLSDNRLPTISRRMDSIGN